MEMENRIIEKLVEMDQKIDSIQNELSTKPSRDEMLTEFDRQGVILQRLDQERLFTLERIKRIEADVEHMKVVLHIA